MSTISDALKKANEVFWIIKAELGRDYYFSTKTLNIPNSGGDDIQVDGLVTNNISLSVALDIRTLISSMPTVSVTLINRDRFQNIEGTIEIDNCYASVYLWCDGLDWTDIDPEGLIFRGMIQKQYHDRYNYSFQIVDLTKQLMRTIPPNVIHIGTWPNHRVIAGGGSVAGNPEPIIYGEFDKGIPLLCVDTVNAKYLIGNLDTKSAEADFNAGTETAYINTGASVAVADYTHVLGYDGLANIVSYLDFDQDQTNNEPLSCSVKGMKDDGAGTYTGTAGTLIEFPGSIIHHLFNVHTNIAQDYVDIASIKNVNNILPIRMASYINDQVNCLDIINRFCNQIVGFVALRPAGKVGVVALNFEAETVGYINTETDVVQGSLRFTKTPLENVVNVFAVEYAYNPSTKKFEGLYSFDRTNNPYCEKSYFNYGMAPFKKQSLYDVQVLGSAVALGNRYLSLYAQRRNLISFTSPIYTVWDYSIGDIVGITASDGPGSWDGKRCIMIEKNYQGSTAQTTWMEV